MDAEEYLKNAYKGFEVEITPENVVSFLPNAVKGNINEARQLSKLINEL